MKLMELFGLQNEYRLLLEQHPNWSGDVHTKFYFRNKRHFTLTADTPPISSDSNMSQQNVSQENVSQQTQTSRESVDRSLKRNCFGLSRTEEFEQENNSNLSIQMVPAPNVPNIYVLDNSLPEISDPIATDVRQSRNGEE